MERRQYCIIALIMLAVCLAVSAVEAKIITKSIPYQSEGFQLEGYLAYDDTHKDKRPGMLVIHEWWGLNDTIRQKVDQLASKGYVAFAVDLYGKGKTTTEYTKAIKMLRMVQMNGYRWHQRGLVGLEVLRKQPQVDPQRVAAIGYGWGGATLQQLVHRGSDIKGAVLFGSFRPPTTEQATQVKAKILILQGAADPYLDTSDFAEYIGAMKNFDLNWQMVLYGGARHGFSDPNAAQYNMEEFAYNEVADRQSWSKTNQFLANLFQK